MGPQGAPPTERGGRREEERVGHGLRAMLSASPAQPGLSSAPPSMKTKDQVYEAFMREMEGLL